MPEHLKKIVLPLPGGERREIELADGEALGRRIDGVEMAVTPNLLPPLGEMSTIYRGSKPSGERQYWGYSSSGSYTKPLCRVGSLSGRYTLTAEYRTARGSLYLSDSTGVPQLLAVDGTEPRATGEIVAGDVWLWAKGPSYSTMYVYDIRLTGCGSVLERVYETQSDTDRRLSVLEKLDEADVLGRVQALETANAELPDTLLPWGGTLDEFRKMRELTEGRTYLLTDGQTLTGAYIGNTRLFPPKGRGFSVSGQLDAGADSSKRGFRSTVGNAYSTTYHFYEFSYVSFTGSFSHPSTKIFPKNYMRMFYMNDALQELSITADPFLFDSMDYMFYYCTSLRSLDISKLDTSNVRSMTYAFYRCTSLGELDLSAMDTSRVTDMSYMFGYCTSLRSLDLSGLDTSEVVKMADLFVGCAALEEIDLSCLDTSKVTTMRQMFLSCKSLRAVNLSGLDTSNVTDMEGLFNDCPSLEEVDISGLDTSNVTNMGFLFCGCSFRKFVMPPLDTSKVRSIRGLMHISKSVVEADLSAMDTSSVDDILWLCNGCVALERLNLSGWDLSHVTKDSGYSSSFQHCTSLRDVTGPVSGICASLSLGYSPLTNESAMVFINGLTEVAAAKTLTFSSATYDSLTEEQIALATSKGWTVAKS